MYYLIKEKALVSRFARKNRYVTVILHTHSHLTQMHTYTRVTIDSFVNQITTDFERMKKKDVTLSS